MKNLNKAILITILLSNLNLSCSSDSSTTDPPVTPEDSTKVAGYQLVWNDEFDNNGEPDDSKWSYDIGGHGWGNNEEQYYTSDSVNVRRENGRLVIESHYYPAAQYQFTSARIVSREKGDWLYGRVEVKAKLPSGRGTWPAIWMLPTDWEYGGWPRSGEIDIMEHVGWQQNVIHGTVHTQAYNHNIGTQLGNQITIPTASTAFHIYRIEWDEDKIDFYVDDDKYFTFNNEYLGWEKWPFDKRFHLVMNIAIGGSWGGVQGIDTSIFPVNMEIDYVRVYKKEGN